MAPDLAIEILSPSNRRRDVEEKLVDHRAAGVGLADRTRGEKVTIHHVKDPIRVLKAKGMLRSDMISGFEIALMELFAP